MDPPRAWGWVPRATLEDLRSFREFDGKRAHCAIVVDKREERSEERGVVKGG